MQCRQRAPFTAAALFGLLVALPSCDFDATGVGWPKHSGDAATSDPATAADAGGSTVDGLWAGVDGAGANASDPRDPLVDGQAAPTEVTICHTRPPHKDMTIVVDSAEVPAHLGHGDHLGPCVDGDADDEPDEPDDD
jgi:hypothetical protein